MGIEEEGVMAWKFPSGAVSDAVTFQFKVLMGMQSHSALCSALSTRLSVWGRHTHKQQVIKSHTWTHHRTSDHRCISLNTRTSATSNVHQYVFPYFWEKLRWGQWGWSNFILIANYVHTWKGENSSHLFTLWNVNWFGATTKKPLAAILVSFYQ